ncbi:MAG: 30S ribosomal protein S2 [Alphaproteobacteria bacterium]
MAIPTFSMSQLVKAGVHFGHHTRRWNPKMGKFIYGSRENVHILDLQKTVPMMYQALQAVSNTVAAGGKVLFVGTKRQAQDPIREAAERCGQYYVNHRWLGGMMTNWKTVTHSINRLKEFNEMVSEGKYEGLTKKETLNVGREREKLDQALGGIKDMNGLPNLVFIIDTNKESLAIKEANKLGIPVVAVCDSNSDPDGIDFPIPGNDDAIRAVKLYCDLVAGAVLDGIQAELSAAGVDIGSSEKVLSENLEDDEASDE